MIQVVSVEDTPLPPEVEPKQHLRGHLLMPEELKMAMPPLYSQQKEGDKAIVYAKYMSDHGWVWLITEFDGHDKMYGWLLGHIPSMGFFSLKEIASLTSYRYETNEPSVRRENITPMPLDEAIARVKAQFPWRKWDA